MKRLTALTFTAMLALAGMANADYHFKVPTGGNFYAGNYSFSFAISEVEGVSSDAASPSLLAAYWGEPTHAPSAGLYTLLKTQDTIKLTVGRGAFNRFAKPASGLEYCDSATFTTNLKDNTVYTITVLGMDQSAGGQVVTLSKGKKKLEIIRYEGNINGGTDATPITSYFNQDFDAAKARAAAHSSTFVLYALGAAGLLALFWVALRRKG